MKIYLMMMTYEQMDWLPWAIDQIDACLSFGAIDKALIAEGAHSKAFEPRSPDGSWDYLNDRIGNNPGYHLFDAAPFRKNCSRYDKAQAALLNHMLDTVGVDDETWVFYIHDDEFFFHSFLKQLRSQVEEAHKGGYDMILTRQLGFAYNFELHWKQRTAYLLNRWYPSSRWTPATTPTYANGRTYLKERSKILLDTKFEHITFHFGHVKRPSRMEMRYLLSKEKKTKHTYDFWWREIYMQADLSNLEPIYAKNEQFLGHGFKREIIDFDPPLVQPLSVYQGEYPESLHNHPYRELADCRTLK